MSNPRNERNLPAVIESSRVASYAALPVTEPEAGRSIAPIHHYLWLLRRHAWKIVAFVAVCVLSTFLVSSRITPMYEATATLDVDRSSPTGVIGQEAMNTGVGAFDADQFMATQIRIIQSDSVVRPVAQRFNLIPVPVPKADKATAAGAAKVSLPGADEAPVSLGGLTVARPPNTYLLQITYRSPDPRLAADVANAVAASYLKHSFFIKVQSSKLMSDYARKELDDLRAKVEQSGSALTAFERDLNVINPEEKTNILSARLLQLNTEYTNAQADRLRKEAAFNSLRSNKIEPELNAAQGVDIKRLLERLNSEQEKFSQMKLHLAENHPDYKKEAALIGELQRQIDESRATVRERVSVDYQEAATRENMLRKAVQETKAEFDRLNARSFQYQTLKREAEADKKLYEDLERNIKEKAINSNVASNNSVRLADPARPSDSPVSPNTRNNVWLAFILSSLLAVGAALVSDMMDNTIRDPEQASRLLEAPVVGTLPRVKNWRTQLLPGASAAAPGQAGDFGLVKSNNGNGSYISNTYQESVRTLRNSILLADFDRQLRSLLITSAVPGEGKSTTAVNLAMAHAEQQKKTLLIDADLRRPSIHKTMQLNSTQGMTDVVAQSRNWRDVMVKDAVHNLDVLPAGPPSRHASDLVGQALSTILQEAGRDYDLIIVDGPPLLGFAEPLQMATAADGVLIVTQAGETSRKAVGSVVQTLVRLRANIVGIVLNQITNDMSDSYYYYGSYRKYYKASAAS